MAAGSSCTHFSWKYKFRRKNLAISKYFYVAKCKNRTAFHAFPRVFIEESAFPHSITENIKNILGPGSLSCTGSRPEPELVPAQMALLDM